MRHIPEIGPAENQDEQNHFVSAKRTIFSSPKINDSRLAALTATTRRLQISENCFAAYTH